MKTVVLQPDELREHLKYFMDQPGFSFDVEAVGEYRGVPHKNTVTWLSLATNGRGIVVPFGHPNGDVLITPPRKKLNRETNTFDFFPPVWSDAPEQMRPGQVFEILEPLFISEDHYKVAQNLPYDAISLYKYLGNRFPAPPYRDTLVEQWLLDENRLDKKLKSMLRDYYGWDYDKHDTGKRVEEHPFKRVAHYGYMDAKGTWLLDKDFIPRIKDEGLWDIFQLEMNLLPTLLKMQITGIPVDEARLHELNEKLSHQIIVDEHKIYDAAGKQFNIKSPKQRTTILYGPKEEGNQGLIPKRLTKGGLKKVKAGKEVTIHDYSTDADALELYPRNKVVAALTAYAETSKVLTTYVQGYLGVPDEGRPCRIYEGRIHAEFVQSGTVTGRFSCREPNLQNIPTPGSELGKQVRGLFIAPPDSKLIVADYGQIELVILASFCGSGRLFDGFHAGIDAHTATAASVFGVKPEDVTKHQRGVAKALNFAIVYGAGDAKVALMAKITERQAKEFLETHQKLFPEIYKYKREVIRRARQQRPPGCTTILGRKRRVPTIMASDWAAKSRGERQLFNSLIQGSAADIIKLAMIRLDNALPDSMQLVLTVHDELVTIVPNDEVETGISLVREAMEGKEISSLLRVPPKADIKVVERWSEAK